VGIFTSSSNYCVGIRNLRLLVLLIVGLKVVGSSAVDELELGSFDGDRVGMVVGLRDGPFEGEEVGLGVATLPPDTVNTIYHLHHHTIQKDIGMNLRC
jgi:hypothetical protein